MKPERMAQLAKYFGIAARHFNLSAPERHHAWQSAKTDPHRALVCYRSISNSLKTRKT